MQKKILSLFVCICCTLLAGAQTPQPVKQLLEAHYMKGATFSLCVKELSSGNSVYSYNPDLLVSPASVLKTVATASALEILGENYRYPTDIQYDGVIVAGVLKGNLYIKGSGDPSLGSSFFASDRDTYTLSQNRFVPEWTAALREAGIRKIEGAVISDESVFDTEGVSVKWVREDMGNYYAPGSYGLSVADNLYKLFLQTGAPGTRPAIKGSEPDVSFIRFTNYLKATPITSDSAYIVGGPFSNERSLYGALPANRSNFTLKGDIPDPALFLAGYLTDCLTKAGIAVTGTPSCYRIEAEAGRWKTGEKKTVITTYSPALKDIVRVTNHVSHNLFADALIKTIGLKYTPSKEEAISSFGRGIRVITAYWAKKGLDVSALRISDGSGLAPSNKVSAAFVGDLLAYMATQSRSAEAFNASLPQAGLEGSVRNFLKGTTLQGKARLKSGGITGVRSYAGYIRIDNKTYAIAVFSNNYACSMGQMTRALEQLLNKLFCL